MPGTEPMPSSVTLEAVDGGTRMTAVTRFASTEQMQAMLERGMDEGMGLAIGQIDSLLASTPA